MTSDGCLKRIVDHCYRAFAAETMSLKEWADIAGLCPQTIERIASGETRFPRFQTVISMARAVGIDSIEVRIVHTKQRKAG